MVSSIALLVMAVAIIGYSSAQSLKVPLGKCKKNTVLDPSHYGKCGIYHARNTFGRSCEMDARCNTPKMEVCVKNIRSSGLTKWEVDFVDPPNHYVCITRQDKQSSICHTYFKCFYHRVNANQEWPCVFAMRVNHYQLFTENSTGFKTIEIKISRRVGIKEDEFCNPTTFLALNTRNSTEASVIAYCEHSARNLAKTFAGTALDTVLVTKLGNEFCSTGETSVKGCKWSNWTDVSGCERRFNNPTATCNKTRARYPLSQDRDTQPSGCNATEVQSIECTKEDVLTGCDLDCTMSEWTIQPCSPSQLPNGRLLCKRNLTRTIQINQTGNGAKCGELNKQQECKINDSDAMDCLTECKLSSWSTWTKCHGSSNQCGFQESQRNRTRTVTSEAWVPKGQRFDGMICKNFHLEETEMCVGTTGTTSGQTRKSGFLPVKPPLNNNITQKRMCFALEDREITEIELHYAASISEDAGTSGLGPVATKKIRAKSAEYGQNIIFSLHQNNISLLTDNVVHLLVRIKIIDTENGRRLKKRSATLKKKLAGHLQQMFDRNPIIIRFNNNEKATLKGKSQASSKGDEKKQARCYGWMIGLGSVAVSLFLVGMVAILVAVEPWKRGSSRQVVVQAGGEGAVAQETGEVVGGVEGESVSM